MLRQYTAWLVPVAFTLFGFGSQHLSWENYQNLDSLKEKVSCIVEEVSPEIIVSLTEWDYILSALSNVA